MKNKNLFNQKKLNKIGEFKRKIFQTKIENLVTTFYAIGECCITKNDYPQDFKNSHLFDDDFGDNVLSRLKLYDKRNYIRINYQNCINPAININLCDRFLNQGNDLKANKYDINSAFISCLISEDFLLPTSNEPSVFLVNQDANYFFHNIDEDDNNFGFVKAFCIPIKNETFNFFPYNSEKFGIQYTSCSKCCENNEDVNLCKHNENDRGFFVETYLTDLLYFKKYLLGKINVVQIIYFKSQHNKNLSLLAHTLIEYRQNAEYLEKLFSKQIALIGMGRFAFNVSKHFNKKTKIIDNYPELTFNLEGNKLHNIDFYDNFVIARQKYKMSNYENKLFSSRLNCSSLMFGCVNNKIRRELYDIYLRSKYIHNFKILRFDTDSFILAYPKHLTKNDIQENFIKKSKFNYKLEYENIEELVNLKKRSHYFVCQEKTIIKIPGLSINVQQRNNIYNDGVNI